MFPKWLYKERNFAVHYPAFVCLSSAPAFSAITFTAVFSPLKLIEATWGTIINGFWEVAQTYSIVGSLPMAAQGMYTR